MVVLFCIAICWMLLQHPSSQQNLQKRYHLKKKTCLPSVESKPSLPPPTWQARILTTILYQLAALGSYHCFLKSRGHSPQCYVLHWSVVVSSWVGRVGWKRKWTDCGCYGYLCMFTHALLVIKRNKIKEENVPGQTSWPPSACEADVLTTTLRNHDVEETWAMQNNLRCKLNLPL